MEIPKDIKVQPPEWPSVSELARELAKHLEPKAQLADRGIRTVEIMPENVAKALLLIATNVWRIQVKLTDSVTREPRDEMGNDELKKVNRYIESILESFKSIGMEVKDRT